MVYPENAQQPLCHDTVGRRLLCGDDRRRTAQHRRLHEICLYGTLFRMPERQKELLIAISKAGDAESLTSGAFLQKYRLSSASSVQSATKGLLEKDYITHEQGKYRIYDQFFGVWLNENY